MGSDAIWQYADENSKDTSEWAIEMAKKYHTYMAVGYLEKRNGDYFNSYLIADWNKVYGIVRKSEGESYIFKTGDFPNVIATPIGNIAVAICYDSRRKHFYNNIKDEMISLILFPHGSPSDPNKASKEQAVIDTYCKQYVEAYNVPVAYINCKGKLDYMMGKTGEMMMKASFVLNGMSKIYSVSGTKLNGVSKEIIGISVNLVPQKMKKEIKFYGEDIVKGNWLFRKLILVPDTKKGKEYYNKQVKHS